MRPENSEIWYDLKQEFVKFIRKCHWCSCRVQMVSRNRNLIECINIYCEKKRLWNRTFFENSKLPTHKFFKIIQGICLNVNLPGISK